MSRLVHLGLAFVALVLGLNGVTRAETHPIIADASLAAILNFETEQPATSPSGWGGGPAETIAIDRSIVHAGNAAARIARSMSSGHQFSSLTKCVLMDFSGQRVEFRGWIRTEDVTGYAGLWLREDGAVSSLEFETMQRRRVRGTTEWSEYSISVPVNPRARRLYFGFLVAGTGQGWVDDLQLLVDGKPIWQAPKVTWVETAFERDHEFDAGSGIQVSMLSPGQTANLATLGRVWGFLKYHHPAVTAGALHWDYELFRVLPAVIAADDQSSANAAMVAWIDRLGPLTPGVRPSLPDADLALRPDLVWIDDRAMLGSALSDRLRAVYATCPTGQFYVSLVPHVNNPSFDNEPDYAGITLPDAGYQLLGLFRYWNIIRYWYPYRDLVSEDWDAVLSSFIPTFALAKSADAYQLGLLSLITVVSDTHANLWSSLRVRPPVGDSQLPVVLRCVEGEFVVTDVLSTRDDATAQFRRGDVILALDGTPVTDLVRRWSPYYAASNEPTRLRELARFLTRGPAGAVDIQLRRDGSPIALVARRVLTTTLPEFSFTHDLPGPAFRLLSPKVAYLKVSSAKLADISAY